MKILLVEDSRTSVLLVQTLLQDDPLETYDLHVAGTLSDAQARLDSEKFDLILLDLTLPDTSGLATVDSIFKVADGTGIVVLTAQNDEELGLAALRHGAQDFLVKDETYRRVLLRAIKYARQRSLAEKEIREAKELAEFATRSKSSFIANLSHELRTPLNAVIGFSEMMLSGITGKMTDKQHEYTNDIFKSGRYLLGLIGTVLDISKIEANKLELHNGIVNMRDIIADVVERLQGAYHDGKIEIVVDVAPGLPKLYGDETMLTQVVTNLIGNAVKYSPDGGEVRVSAAVEDADMIFIVKDEGIGIPKDEIEKVLQPFGRTEQARQSNIDGTGLGLPLTKGLVEAHGGTLMIESDTGKGTTVTVRLPEDRLRN
jgi:signal transduction histidine kinase